MAFSRAKHSAYDSVAKQQYFRANFAGLSAHERHQKFVKDYVLFYGGPDAQSSKPQDQLVATDLTTLQAGHRFIRSAEDDVEDSWEARLSKRYYQRLFKEYCIADLSRYRESKLGLRWRTQGEVVSGKGQFSCGAKGCEEKAGLCSYEVNFAYDEAGQRKQALVKLRVCPSCAYKLNYKKESQYKKAAGAVQQHGKRTASEPVDGRSSKRANLAAAEQLLARVAAGESVEHDSINPPPARSGSGQRGSDLASAGSSVPPEAVCVLPGDDSLWEQKPVQESSTAEEDFEQYFEGLFA